MKVIVNVQLTPEEFTTIASALIMCASWLENYPEDNCDIELAKKIREARKTMMESAAMIKYE